MSFNSFYFEIMTASIPSWDRSRQPTPRRELRRKEFQGRSCSHMPKFNQPRRNRIMNARYLPFIGRLLLGLPFAMSGLGKLAAYGPPTELISAAGLPLPPLAFAVAVAVELGGGLFLIFGYRARPAALALAVFLLATAVSFHNNF